MQDPGSKARVRKLLAGLSDMEYDWDKDGAFQGKPKTLTKADLEPMEPCCDCGEPYPRIDLHASGYIYCPKCRAIRKEREGR